MKTANLKRTTSKLHTDAFELLKQGKFKDAQNIYEEILEIDEDNDSAQHFIGLIHSHQGRFDQAVESIEKAIDMYPWVPDYYNSLSGALLMNNKFDEAVVKINKALELNPMNSAAHNNKGMILMELGRHDEAVEAYEKALERSSNEEAYIHFNYAIALLSMGKWLNGFQEYEWRHALYPSNYAHLTPRYLTQVYGTDVLLVHEQGYGDTIQMVRYVKLLRKHVKRIGIWCPPELLGLFKCLPIDEFNSPNTAYDQTISMLSLPRLFDTTPDSIPENHGYLLANKNSQRCYAPDDKMFNIGVVWGSRRPPENSFQFTQNADATRMLPSARGMVHFSSHKRSFHPNMFKNIAAMPNVKLFSLQKGPDAEQLKECQFQITDLGSRFNDFTHTASAIDELDLIITIDTSVAHLAGALNKKTFLILPYSSEWRWGFEKKTTPWYESMRIFKQPKIGDWDSVFASVEAAITMQVGGI